MYNIILEQLISNDIVKEEDSEFIIYGLKQMVSDICFFTIQIILYAIFKKLFGGIIFLAAFILLRRFAGGYHADTKLRCFFLSNLISVFYIIMCSVKLYAAAEIIMLPVSSFIILLLAPVDNISKRLEEDEKKKYKKTAVSILFTEILCVFIFGLFFPGRICKSFLCSIEAAAVLVLTGRIKNKLKYNI